ncbi:MAG: membrane protease subunit, stomatin/prohibitin [Acidobacteria bacterium RBG_13_68_16]|jgi:regulator of protease activity HflC (stomatin/prohibitin superfamily)|nr:MAG: membrane protease subunit, stomatin/prohibitin [Acidobacteria bacterium RBG_13_68_16]
MLFILSVLVAIIALVAFGKLASAGRGDGFPVVGASRAGVGIVALLAALVAVSQVLTVIPAGHVGVVDFFGTVSPVTLKAGINFVNPLARVFKFSVKTQEIKETMDVPSKEGLTVQLEISALFHLDPDKAAEVYKSIGPNYIEIILEPQVRSVVRGVTAGYEAKALYTSEREMLAEIIQKDLQKLVGPRGITVEASPLRRVGLPVGLTQAIEEKLRAEQESQRMQFVLLKEKQEAERKRIEAQGIADFQMIVTKGISEPLLRWKGIEATEKLAASQNAKVVIIGAGKDGLPLILDTK